MVEAVAVLDVGKTHAKLTLVDHEGRVLATRMRANAAPMHDGRPTLDAERIETWAIDALKAVAEAAHIVAIAPVGHGAAAALVAGDRLAAPVMDYEAAPPGEIARAYDAERDPFALTGSPRLPLGLNLGQQLYWQESLCPDAWPAQAQALLWPQYWAWRFSGERAAEVSSLGCHTDLWRPHAGGYAPLAERRGWADRFPPIQAAGAVLGTLRADVAAEAGLPRDCQVLCGVHDSNASLFAARAFPETFRRPFSLISTGTWFVTFQSGGGAQRLDPARDVLVNVDVEGHPVPSTRFMGGREYAEILGDGIGARPTLETAASVIEAGVRTHPAFAPGGPFPGARGTVVGAPGTLSRRASLASLHLALMSDVELDLVGAEGPVVIEGRFADDPVFPAALAALRTDRPVYACPGGSDAVAFGAARLFWPALHPPQPLHLIEPAPFDLAAYAHAWRAAAHAETLTPLT
ncbi:MAG TPA: carbohydrate kinase [Caulobacteraceae bacterium]|nr:carbohydrate kinase [Caulobacteraceae bacterium]